MSSDTGCLHLLSQSPPALPLVFSLERVVFPVLGQFGFFKRFYQFFFFLNTVAVHQVGADVSGELQHGWFPGHAFHAGDHLSLAPATEGLLPFMSWTYSQVLTLRFATVASRGWGQALFGGAW